MRPLTDHTPKPLLQVRGKALLQWHLEALARGGLQDVVINTAWLGPQIPAYFGHQFTSEAASNNDSLLSNNEQKGTLRLHYSHEGQALETAGGIVRALPLLRPAQSPDAAFWVLAGDVFAPDFRFSAEAVARFLASGQLAHLWLVPNPAHNPGGDFGLECGLALNRSTSDSGPRYTFSTIALYRAALFAPPWCTLAAGNPQGVEAPLAPLLRKAMDAARVSAEIYTGAWTDVGTPQRLAQLNGTAADASTEPPGPL